LGSKTEPAKVILNPGASNIILADQNVPLPASYATPLPSMNNENPAPKFINPVISFFENLFKGWF
jgi:hypothetical protein